MDRTSRRDPKNRDHKMTRDEAVALGPDFYLNRYFTAVGTPSFTAAERTQSRFLQAGERVLESESLDSLKIYVSWHVLNGGGSVALAAVRGCPFQICAESFTGQKEIQARWKRCVTATDNALGEALGQRYVERDLRRGRQAAHAEDGGCAGKIA